MEIAQVPERGPRLPDGGRDPYCLPAMRDGLRFERFQEQAKADAPAIEMLRVLFREH